MSLSHLGIGVERIDANRVKVAAASGLDITLFANADVPIDRSSMAELAVLPKVVQTVDDLNARGFFGDGGHIGRWVLTPDFHRSASIPVGTVFETDGLVFPRATGGDVGCGMRLLSTSMTREEFDRIGPGLDQRLRHACFEGGRDLPMSERAREAMLRYGVPGLLETDQHGLWAGLDASALEHEVARAHHGGSWPTDDLWMFQDYVRGSGGTSRDAALGSIGGGNHFLEFQWVAERKDPAVAYRWGLHPGMLVIMVHTGSVGLGSMVGDHFMRVASEIHPAGEPVPGHRYQPLPLRGPLGHHGRAYLSAMGLAANFAFVNRLVLGRMALRCLSEASGREVEGKLVYDAPHNLAWAQPDGRVLHRKGACPADQDLEDPCFPDGIPVIVPGSMGAESWILRGLGGADNLASAPHGAGRLASRGEGRKGSTSELSELRVVTKVDPQRIRADIAEELAKNLLEEAPSAYKPVMPAIDTCRGAGIAEPVVVLRPLLTVKG